MTQNKISSTKSQNEKKSVWITRQKQINGMARVLQLDVSISWSACSNHHIYHLVKQWIVTESESTKKEALCHAKVQQSCKWVVSRLVGNEISIGKIVRSIIWKHKQSEKWLEKKQLYWLLPVVWAYQFFFCSYSIFLYH